MQPSYLLVSDPYAIKIPIFVLAKTTADTTAPSTTKKEEKADVKADAKADTKWNYSLKSVY